MQLYLNVGSFRWDCRSQMFFKIGVLRNFAIFTGKHLRWSHFHRTRPVAGDILINKLRLNVLTSFAYCTSYELRDIFIARVTSYLLHVSSNYCLLDELPVTFIARVTSYCLLHELLVTVYCTSHELLFAYELRVIVYCTSYKLLFCSDLQ